MNAIQRYELIRPILNHEKTPKQVSEETGISLSNIYRYLKQFQEGGNIQSLVDKSHANHWHPNWLTREDKDKVIQYKLQRPHLSARQVAKALAEENLLQINYHSVADILKEHSLATPFLPISHTN